jgi:hypothetical protein
LQNVWWLCCVNGEAQIYLRICRRSDFPGEEAVNQSFELPYSYLPIWG